MRISAVLAAVLIHAICGSAAAQTGGINLDATAIFNIGKHAGSVWYATTKCGGEIAPAFKHAGGIARGQSEAAFARGFKAGAEQAEKNHRTNGSDIGCRTSLMLYGPTGANVPNAWLAPKKN